MTEAEIKTLRKNIYNKYFPALKELTKQDDPKTLYQDFTKWYESVYQDSDFKKLVAHLLFNKLARKLLALVSGTKQDFLKMNFFSFIHGEKAKFTSYGEHLDLFDQLRDNPEYWKPIVDILRDHTEFNFKEYLGMFSIKNIFRLCFFNVFNTSNYSLYDEINDTPKNEDHYIANFNYEGTGFDIIYYRGSDWEAFNRIEENLLNVSFNNSLGGIHFEILEYKEQIKFDVYFNNIPKILEYMATTDFPVRSTTDNPDLNYTEIYNLIVKKILGR